MVDNTEIQTVIEPVGDRLLVRPDEAANVTKGGLFLPDQAREKPAQGTVVAVGAGRKLENGSVVPMCIQEGDSVIFSKYAGTDLKVNGTDMILLREGDVLAKVR